MNKYGLYFDYTNLDLFTFIKLKKSGSYEKGSRFFKRRKISRSGE